MHKKCITWMLIVACCFPWLGNRGFSTRILCCDGGGICGVVTLEILSQLKQETGMNPNKDFEIYAGTSTGAIIAVLLALGVEVEEILTFYKEISASVFSSPHYFNFVQSKYSNEQLRSNLIYILTLLGYSEDMLLCELPKKVIIPVVSLANSQQGCWGPIIRENLTQEGGKVRVIDALLESTAAPTYFPSYHGCIDGGIGMNDPSLIAIAYVHEYEKIDLKEITVLSIGTGEVHGALEGDVNWGIMQWASQLPPILIDVSNQLAVQVSRSLIGDAFMKVNIFLPQGVELDDYKNIDYLLAITDYLIQHNPSTWAKWCKWINTHILEVKFSF